MYLVYNHESVGLRPINAPNNATWLDQPNYLPKQTRLVAREFYLSLAGRNRNSLHYTPAEVIEILTAMQHARLAAFWTVAGALGTLAVFPYALALNPTLLAQLPMPLPVLIAAQTAQTSILLLLLSWVCLRLGQPIGIDSPFARALAGRQKLSIESHLRSGGGRLGCRCCTSTQCRPGCLLPVTKQTADSTRAYASCDAESGITEPAGTSQPTLLNCTSTR